MKKISFLILLLFFNSSIFAEKEANIFDLKVVQVRASNSEISKENKSDKSEEIKKIAKEVAHHLVAAGYPVFMGLLLLYADLSSPKETAGIPLIDSFKNGKATITKSDQVLAQVKEIKEKLGIKRDIAVYTSDRIAMNRGFSNKIIVDNFNFKDELEGNPLIIAHELVHSKHHDALKLGIGCITLPIAIHFGCKLLEKLKNKYYKADTNANQNKILNITKEISYPLLKLIMTVVPLMLYTWRFEWRADREGAQAIGWKCTGMCVRSMNEFLVDPFHPPIKYKYEKI